MNIYQDLRQNKNYPSYMQDLGWGIDEYKGIHIYFKKIFFWSFVKVQRPNNLIVKEFNSYFLRKYKRSTVYVEPANVKQCEEFVNSKFKKYNSPFLPSKTVQIDLGKSEDQLLKEMHHKTRYNIIHNLKLNNPSCVDTSAGRQNSKLRIQTTNNIEEFAEFWQRCAGQRGMFLSQKKEIRAIYNAFSKDAVMHIAHINNDWLSAILRISTPDISYYMYAASTVKGKKLFVPTILTWEAVKAAKKEGKKVFDFEGIYDERFPLKSWKGFTRFKKGFGGKVIEYPESLVKVFL